MTQGGPYYIGLGAEISTLTDFRVCKAVINEDLTYIESELTYKALSGYNYFSYVDSFDTIKGFLKLASPQYNPIQTGILYYKNSAYVGEITENLQYATELNYYIASNQYTLASSNQLLPGIVGYGKNGNIAGDGSIYDNLDISNIFETYYNCYNPQDYSYTSNNTIIASSLDDIGKIHYLKQSDTGTYYAGNVQYDNTMSDYDNTESGIRCMTVNTVYNSDKTKVFKECYINTSGSLWKDFGKCRIFDTNTKDVLWESTNRGIFITYKNNKVYYVDFTLNSDSTSIYRGVINRCTSATLKSVDIDTLLDTSIQSIYVTDPDRYYPLRDYGKILLDYNVSAEIFTSICTISSSSSGRGMFDTTTWYNLNTEKITTWEKDINTGSHSACYITPTLTSTIVTDINYANSLYTWYRYEVSNTDEETDLGYDASRESIINITGSVNEMYKPICFKSGSYLYNVVDKRKQIRNINYGFESETITVEYVGDTSLIDTIPENISVHYITYNDSDDKYYMYDNTRNVLIQATVTLGDTSTITIYNLLDACAGIVPTNSIYKIIYSTSMWNATYSDNMWEINIPYGKVYNAKLYRFMETDVDNSDTMIMRTDKDNTEYQSFMYFKYPTTDYTNTISPTEYNTALNTSEQILGEEETVNE